MAAGDRHAAAMHADGYWRQFTATMDFLEPGEEVIGTIEHLGEVKTRDGWLPRLHIRQGDGVLVHVNCGPKRLVAELIRLRPKVGDRIRIRYLGDEERSAPGMNPVRRFAVAVRPAGSPAAAPVGGASEQGESPGAAAGGGMGAGAPRGAQPDTDDERGALDGSR